MPTGVESSFWVKPCSGTWHIAQERVSLKESRLSKNRRRPSSMPAAVTDCPSASGGSPRGGLAAIACSRAELAPRAPMRRESETYSMLS